MRKKINPIFYQVFRSITLVLDSKTSDSKLSPPINMLLYWLSRYDTWWTKATGITKGKNLHLLYGRYVTCVGSRILRFIPELMEIASLSSSMGCIFALEIELNEIMHHGNLFNELLNSGKIGVLSIYVKTTEKKDDFAAHSSLIDMIVRKGISLNLLGPLTFWKDLGVLNSPILNSSSFKIIPSINQYKSLNSSMRSNGKSESVSYSFNPCSERFQIYIDPDGVLYPCKGLIGISSCSIGTIYDIIEDTILAGDKESYLDFKNLAKCGPSLQFDETISHFDGLDPICFFHRDSILESKRAK